LVKKGRSALSEASVPELRAPLTGWQPYLVAVAATAVTVGLHVLIGRMSGAAVLLMFVLPIILSAYAGGLGPGLCATALCCLGANYYALAPIGHFSVASISQRWELVFLASSGILISLGSQSRLVSAGGDGKNTAELARNASAAARLVAVVESSDDAIISEDMNGIVTNWNRGATKIFGYSAEEMIGRSIRRIIPADRPEEEEALFKRIRKGESVEHFETMRVRKDGRHIMVSLSVSPIRGAAGEIIGASKTARDITEERRMEAELRGSQSQLRSLATNLRTVREEEAVRISREIHDQLGQALTGVQMDVMSLRRAMEKRRQSKEQAGTVAKLNMISEEIETTLQIARRVATELRPALLDSLGLAAAIEWQTREFEERASLFCNITLPEESVELDPERGTAVFRIFQEVLTNIVRHARATEVSVVLRMNAGAIVLEVSDNGVGIEPSKRSHLEGHGLLGIQERALAAGLRVTLTSEPGQGTCTTIEVPTEGGA